MTKLELKKLTDFLAGVMGWTYCPADDWNPPCWKNSAGVRVRWEGIGNEGFDPLHDANHMALVRAKMREKGYKRLTEDMVDGTSFVRYIYPNPWIHSHGYNKNELIAEALAIKAAVLKERA